MAPESLNGQGYGQATDMWSFGCLVYEMLVGRPPFCHENKDEIFNLIKHTSPKLDYPFLSVHAKDLLYKLL